MAVAFKLCNNLLRDALIRNRKSDFNIAGKLKFTFVNSYVPPSCSITFIFFKAKRIIVNTLDILQIYEKDVLNTITEKARRLDRFVHIHLYFTKHF